MSEIKKININQKSIELSNLDKIFYPDKKYSKEEVINYYRKIADYMIPHLKGHPLVMQRFPDGINKEGFYQKEIPDYFPAWIKSKRVNLEKNGYQKLVIVEKKADLVYLANQGTLVFHIWLSTQENITHPDKIIFDLDPPESNDFDLVKFAAQQLRQIFEKKDLNTLVMTTGSKGLHIIIPIHPEHHFDKIREFARETAKELADQYPGKLTTEMRKEERKGRVFLDYLRNAFGQTGVAPYSLRAIKGAPIATPLHWSELSSLGDAQKYNLSNIFQRLSHKEDPWKNMYEKAKGLEL